MKNIIFIAPPAAGKGTQSKILEHQYHIPHISSGDILRNAACEQTSRGYLIKNLIEQGKFVTDETMLELFSERLKKEDCNQGYILDGFPRSIIQVSAYEVLLQQLGKELGIVILLDISEDNAKKRIFGRLSCSNCGAVYNDELQAQKPIQNGICDLCHHELSKRNDDNEQTFHNRYQTYLEQTAPLIMYFKEKGILYTVDANQDTNQITDAIEEIIKEVNA